MKYVKALLIAALLLAGALAGLFVLYIVAAIMQYVLAIAFGIALVGGALWLGYKIVTELLETPSKPSVTKEPDPVLPMRVERKKIDALLNQSLDDYTFVDDFEVYDKKPKTPPLRKSRIKETIKQTAIVVGSFFALAILLGIATYYINKARYEPYQPVNQAYQASTYEPVPATNEAGFPIIGCVCEKMFAEKTIVFNSTVEEVAPSYAFTLNNDPFFNERRKVRYQIKIDCQTNHIYVHNLSRDKMPKAYEMMFCKGEYEDVYNYGDRYFQIDASAKQGSATFYINPYSKKPFLAMSQLGERVHYYKGITIQFTKWPAKK